MDHELDPNGDDEALRLARLGVLGLLEVAPEPPFDDLVRAAADLCGTPAGLFSVADANRPLLRTSPDPEVAARLGTFSACALEGSGVFEVHDARDDPRFANHPAVAPSDGLRFYAGVPVILADGERIGVLAVIDTRPARLRPNQRRGLERLAGAVSAAVASREQLRSAAVSLRLASIVDHSDDAIIGKTLDGVVTCWNTGAERLFGHSRVDMAGQDMLRLFPPGREHEEDELLARVRSGETVSQFDTVRRHKDGRLVEVSVSLSPIRDESGSVIAIAKVARDISHRKGAERALAASEARYRALIEAQSELVSLARPDGTLTFVNSAYARMFGMTREQMTGSSLYDYVPPEQRPAVAAHLARVCSTDSVFQDENRMLAADGREHWVAWTNLALHDETGSVVAIHSVGRDVTEHHAIEQERAAHRREIARHNELLRTTLASIGEGVITCDASGQVTWLNLAAERMCGWTTTEARGRAMAEVFCVINGTTRAAVDEPVGRCLALGVPVTLAPESVLVARDGAEYAVEDTAAPIRTADGKMIGAVLVFRDVTEQRRLAGEIHFRATHDALTGVHNRSEFDLRLNELLLHTHERGGVHALLFLDLDHFKAVNDQCGHLAGDRLLREIAGLFRAHMRTHDVLARLGGDEFGVLLEDCDAEAAFHIAEDMVRRVDAYAFNEGGRHFQVGVSIGVVGVDRQSPPPLTLLRRADQACYAAKASGRRNVQVWSGGGMPASRAYPAGAPAPGQFASRAPPP